MNSENLGNDILNESDEILEQVEHMFEKIKSRDMKKYLATHGELKHKEFFFNEYKELRYCYPAIFNMLYETKDNFDITRLKGILKQRDRINKKETTLNDASKEFGQEMFNEYTKPIVDKLEKH